MYDCTKLVEVCNEFAFKNFRAIAKLNGFKMLEVDYVNFLLSSGLEGNDGLKCKALMTWINYDLSRAASLFGLMQHINFSQVPMTYRRFLTESEPAISNSNECLKHVFKSIFDGGDAKASDLSFDEAHAILVLDSKAQTLKRFDLEEKTWSNVQDHTTFCLQLRKANSAWEQMANRSGSWGSAVMLNAMIYCTEHKKCSKRIEQYNLQQNQWSFIADRSSLAAYSAIAVLQGNLFSIGGLHLSQYSVNTVERFDPTISSWSIVPSLQQARHSASAATLNDAIYLFGGCGDSGYVQSVEIYCNTTWELVNLASIAKISQLMLLMERYFWLETTTATFTQLTSMIQVLAKGKLSLLSARWTYSTSAQ